MADQKPSKKLRGKGTPHDLTGKRVGLLTVTADRETRLRARKTHLYWRCECDCGNSKWIMSQSLIGNVIQSCGCSRIKKSRAFRESLVGQRFGKLIVVASVSDEPTRRCGKIRVKCDCGTDKVVIADLVRNGLQACGCERAFAEGVAARNIVLSRYKKDARRRKKEWALSDQYAIQLLSLNCHYCGSAPMNVQGPGASGRWNGEFRYSGIDRKDSDLGYSLENVVPCCGTCNRAKNTTPYELFVRWADRLADYRQSISDGPTGNDIGLGAVMGTPRDFAALPVG